MHELRHALQGLLLRELRAAVTAKIDGCADAGQVTADLEQRLGRICELQRIYPAVSNH